MHAYESFNTSFICSVVFFYLKFLCREAQVAAGSRPYTSIPRVEAQNSYTVKVYHISMTVSVQQLESIYMRYGPCSVNLRHPRMDEDQHAFVAYTSLKEAQTAARATNGSILVGERITAKVEGYPSSSQDGCTIKVENLSKTTTEETLDEVFSFFGDVKVIGIKLRNTAAGSNYAYVYYSRAQDAQRAVSEHNRTKIDESVVWVKLHSLKETMQLGCEPLIVQTIMSPDRPEYSTQLQTIESTNLVMIKSMENKQGFNVQGSKESLEEVKSHLELIISKVQKRLGEKSFTLPCYVPLFADHKTVKQISEIEHKYCVQFFAFNSSKQQLVDMSAFSRHVSAQRKSRKGT